MFKNYKYILYCDVSIKQFSKNSYDEVSVTITFD